MTLDRDEPKPSGGSDPAWKAAFASHPRLWQGNRYVYPVLSRRARGISIGINLSPDKVCNFQCVYCQVVKSGAADLQRVDLDTLRAELDRILSQARTGELLAQPPFADVPEPMRRVSDIAFSGDGEPTAAAAFPSAVQTVIEAARKHALPDLKTVVLTNATLLNVPAVRDGLDLLHRHRGEVWAKLDAGTQEHYRQMNRCAIPLQTILDNIALATRRWRVRIQSMWLQFDANPVDPAQVRALADRLREILDTGGQIQMVQVYTIARPPAESSVSAMPADDLQFVADQIADRTGLPVEVFATPEAM